MEPIVKLVLPLITWNQEKMVGPLFKPDGWHAVALSLVPPSDSLVNTILREYSDLDSPALLSPTWRRRVRNERKRCMRHELRGNPLASAVRQYLLKWRQELEAMGYTADPARIRKLRDINSETNDFFRQLLQGQQLPEEVEQLVKVNPDATNLLWEFALYGEGGSKPVIGRSSAVWKIFGLDPKKLESMSDADGFILFFHRIVALLGLAGQPPDKPRLLRLTKWVVRTHLPHQKEPATTPEAISKAVKAGLIHRTIVTRDKETGEVTGTYVEDTNATRFIHEVEVRDELDRIISRAKLSAGERLVLQGMRQALAGEQLVEWVKKQGADIAPDSVPVLASRVVSRLRAAAKT